MPDVEFLISFLDLIVSGFSVVWHYIETPFVDLLSERVPFFFLIAPFLPDAFDDLNLLRLSISAIIVYLAIQLWIWIKNTIPGLG